MRLRKLSREVSLCDDEDIVASENLEFDILKDERNRQLYSALEKLTPQYREILILIYFENMSHEEAGRVMRKSRKQTYNLVQRGQKALKEQLERISQTNKEN
jgi:RNA polymerase sigma-70 factor (ECF subfamily)